MIRLVSVHLTVGVHKLERTEHTFIGGLFAAESTLTKRSVRKS